MIPSWIDASELKATGIMTGVLAGVSILLRIVFPPPSGWYELASDFIAFAASLPMLYILRKKAGIVACLIWLASIGLAFVIKPDSRYIWIPDATLLAGFLPLLVSFRPGWPWLLFGIPTTFIGLILLLSVCLPDEPFLKAGKQVVEVKHHLALYHPPWPWVLSGLGCAVAGVILTGRDIVRFLSRKGSSQTTSLNAAASDNVAGPENQA